MSELIRLKELLDKLLKCTLCVFAFFFLLTTPPILLVVVWLTV